MFAINVSTGKYYQSVEGGWTFVAKLVRQNKKDTPVVAFARLMNKRDHKTFTYTRKGDWVKAEPKITADLALVLAECA